MKCIGIILFIQAFIPVQGSGQGCIRSVIVGSSALSASPCAEWATANGFTAGIHAVTLDPDGPETQFGEVNVTCNLDLEPGKACMVLHHDQEARTLVDGYEYLHAYRIALKYDIGLEAVKKFADISTECKQHVKYECFESLLTVSTVTVGGWENRSLARSAYFTGDGSGSNYCDCEDAGTCEYVRGCQCNANDAVWRQDDGFITNKDDLPVTAFSAGDTGDSYEKAYHTIGPLICC